jgi:hypothetical protein
MRIPPPPSMLLTALALLTVSLAFTRLLHHFGVL